MSTHNICFRGEITIIFLDVFVFRSLERIIMKSGTDIQNAKESFVHKIRQSR